ncbi:MAG: 4-hydroxy-4-methyl-2-oxoglutarate aldolase [Mucilaginibacter sp.]|nr:4-hydroxy-4-methyl-2-oxoglutarate aldolase [Mucilaginibacter sp.]
MTGFTSAILSDALDTVGLRNQVLESRLECATPGTRIFGRARTAEFVPALDLDPQHPYDAAIDFIDAAEPGDLIVIATGASNASAFWGELFSAAAIGRGAVGMITDGNLRDRDKIAALGFGAFARSSRPIDYRGRMQLQSAHGPVTIGEVLISPGDLVMADEDGTVVIPRSAEAEVLAVATARASGESTVLEELVAGATLRTVWEKYQIL